MSDRAAECRTRALTANDVDQRRQYLEMAEGWLRLALRAEQQEREFK
jgi:hypothetical protein